MSRQTSEEIIASASQLPPGEQVAIANALFENAMTADHGPEDSPAEVEAAWAQEIGKRLEDIDSGRVETIPADEAERMIRQGERPQI